MDPWTRPRALEADGLWWLYSSHPSARAGRWNHIAWSRLAILSPGVDQAMPWRRSTDSSTE